MTPSSLAFFVPGRVEILGKHTDYAGGRSLLAAIERGIRLEAKPRGDAVVRVTDSRSGEEARFVLDAELDPVPGHWSNYPMTVARRLVRNFPAARHGAEIVFASDLPPAAGMSSSSALVVATWLVLAAVNEIETLPAFRASIRSREDLAAYLGCVENGQSFAALAGDRGVGTFGGSEDHVAMLCCEAGALSRYAFGPVRREQLVPFPSDHVLVVATSGVRAEKTGAARDAYNLAALSMRTIMDARRRESERGFEEFVDAHGLRDRLEHFHQESDVLVPGAANALARGDLAAFGALVDRSQANAERLLGNQVAETIALARSARALGAVAASAFGAGFGGSVWAMTTARDAERFAVEWRDAYAAAFPARAVRAEVFVTRPGPAATRLR